MKNLYLLLLIICFQDQGKCSKILGIFTSTSKSHYRLGNALMRGLADAGHDVTLISPYEDTEPTKNGSLRNVVLTGFLEQHGDRFRKLNLFLPFSGNSFTQLEHTHKYRFSTVKKTMKHPNVQALVNSQESFDAVIIEQSANDALKIFAHVFNAHLILFSPMGHEWSINNMMRNPILPSYIPKRVRSIQRPMSFLQRIHNTFLQLNDYIVEYLICLPRHDALIQEHFPNAPSIYDLYHNVSLVLINSHVSLWQTLPNVPNLIEIGGHHLQPPKELPNDLRKFLDDSTQGVIYFSFGSVLRSEDLPKAKRYIFLNVFRKLPLNVLWKWEGKDLSEEPPNVKTGEWFPQMDVLAHPNVKLFITHGGLLSMAETVYNGVPILALPVYGDQFSNANTATLHGYGETLAFHDPDFSEDKLLSLLNELLSNSKYRENAKKFSRIFHDRPRKPLDEAIHWIEYVIRHDGAPHLRVDGLKLPWYQYFLLDILIFVSTVLGTAIFLVVFIMRQMKKLISRQCKLSPKNKND